MVQLIKQCLCFLALISPSFGSLDSFGNYDLEFGIGTIDQLRTKIENTVYHTPDIDNVTQNELQECLNLLDALDRNLGIASPTDIDRTNRSRYLCNIYHICLRYGFATEDKEIIALISHSMLKELEEEQNE